MNNILDTHTLIWFINGDKELSNKARKSIESENVQNFISIASLWEIAIKISLKRLDLNSPFEEFVEQIDNNNFQILSITFEDTLALSTLPFHHKDPFDRMIISQSITNNFTIVSKDRFFKDYKVNLVW